MKKIFVILGFLIFALASDAQSPWIKMKVGGDKVEQIPGDIVYNYMDDKVEISLVDNKNVLYLNPKFKWDWNYHREMRNGIALEAVMLTIATFDLKDNRTGYYEDVIAFLFQNPSGIMLWDAKRLNEVNIYSIVRNYLLNKSGSVVFRLDNILGEIKDIEVKTVKTLGYDDAINIKHVDGDVDVLGM